MSEQLTAAAEAMNVPATLVERSARAWATAAGSSYEEVVAAWAGGGDVAASAPAQEAPAQPDAEQPEADQPEPAAPNTVAVPAAESAPEATAPVETPPEAPVAAMTAPASEPEEPLEPVSLSDRIRTASRLGAWIGAGLGLVGFLIASAWLLSLAAVAGEEGAYAPAVEVTTARVILGVTLMSVVFGIVVATLTRTATGWLDAGARLEGRSVVTVSLGAGLGLVLGVAAGAVMVSAFSEPIEGVEGVALMRVVPSLIVVLIGGAAMGGLTAALVQLVGVPAGIEEHDAEAIQAVRRRLSAAISIPVAASALLALLVIPLGLTFIRSNEMASGGAAVLAVLAAAGILGFASLSASRPQMKVGLGEFMVAAAGIATVVLIIFAVFAARAEPEEEAEGDTATEEEATEEQATEEEGPAEETTDTSTPEAGA